jgi:hypothetical protein
MNLETPKQVWDKLQIEFEGSNRVKAVKLLAFKREFELMKMKDNESVKDYSDRLMNVVNKMRLLGNTFEDHKVVEKLMISVPQKFEAKISATEESCDLQNLTIAELISKLHIQEQRVHMRDDEANNKGRSVGNLPRKKLVKFSKGKISIPSRRQILLPCPYNRRTNHVEKDC